MSFLRFNATGLKNVYNRELFFPYDGNSYNYDLLNSRQSALYIMKGVLPTFAETNVATLVNAFRTTDRLIAFGGIGNTNDTFNIEGESLVVRSVTAKAAAATQSGIASWFMWSSYTSFAMNDAVIVFGDVTVAGGGGVLELDSVNIVSGQNYTLKDYAFKFQASWTF